MEYNKEKEEEREARGEKMNAGRREKRDRRGGLAIQAAG